MSIIRADPSRLTSVSWKSYAMRFVFGGLVTAIAGVIAKVFGPVVAGLFLAFPAILPASLTLIAHKEGTKAAGAEACGAVLGCLGLLTFAGLVWAFMARAAGWLVLCVVGLAWLAVSVAAWLAFRWLRHHRRAAPLAPARERQAPAVSLPSASGTGPQREDPARR